MQCAHCVGSKPGLASFFCLVRLLSLFLSFMRMRIYMYACAGFRVALLHDSRRSVEFSSQAVLLEVVLSVRQRVVLIISTCSVLNLTTIYFVTLDCYIYMTSVDYHAGPCPAG